MKYVHLHKPILNCNVYLISLICFLGLQWGSAQNCVVNAGVLNETICENDPLQLIGNDPMPRIGDVEWSQLSGPSVVIETPNATTTNVLGIVGGQTYVFRYKAICGDGIEAFQDKTVTVQSITKADAGVDVEYCPDTGGNITVQANTPIHPGEVGRWEIISANNDAGVTIDFPNSETTTLTMPGTSCGVTTIAWIIEGLEYAPGQRCSSISEIKVTNYGGVTPVNAGLDQSLGNCYTTTQSTNLDATYGGCKLNGQQGEWHFVSGPAYPTFANSNDEDTTVSGLIEGTYVLRWTVTGPCSSASDDVSITVPAATQDVTSLPTSRVNYYICDNGVNEVTLEGGIPEFSGEQVQWTQIGGTVLPGGSIVSPTRATTVVRNLSPSGDPYTFRYTITNAVTGCGVSREYRVRYRGASRTITANGGNDIIGTCGQTDFEIPVSSTGTGSNRYSIVSGPAGSPLGPFPTPLASTSGLLNLNLVTQGTYVLEFVKSEGGELPLGCTDGFDSINIIVSGPSVAANAGTPTNLPCGTTVATLDGNVLATGRSIWSQVSGPNTAVIADPYMSSTTASGLVSGTYVFQYYSSGGTGCPKSYDDVIINVSESSLSIPNPGSAQTICVDAPAYMNATPAAVGEIGTWSQVSGPDTLVISDVNDPNAIITGFNTASSVYELEWELSYENPGPGCATPSTASINITTGATTSPTIANAGLDNCFPSGTTTINLSANPPQTGETGTWTVVPSAGVSFNTINSETAEVTLPNDGIYTFTWTINDASGCLPTTDDVVIKVFDTANGSAGPDQTALCTNSVTMAAIASTGSVGTWSYVSGPGGFNFSDLNDPNATVTFLTSGTYEFRWTVDVEGCSTVSDTVTVEIGIPVTTANAGTDIDVCNSTSVTLGANTFNTNTETGSWSLVSPAPNNPTIANVTDPNTSVSGLVTGIYTFRWTITGTTSSLCTPSFDDVIVEVYTNANAGSDQQLCNVTSIALAATENSVGTWTKVSGPAGEVINASSGSTANVDVTTSGAGTYVFRYTTNPHTFVSGANCPSQTDDVQVVVSAVPSTNPDAGPDQNICNGDTTTANLAGNTVPLDGSTGAWSIVFEPSGSVAALVNDTLPTAQITNLTEPGLYILEWTFTNGNCAKLTDVVRITVYEPPTPVEAGTDVPNACQLTYQTDATLPTVGIGVWSITNAPAGATTVIDSPNNPETTLSNIEIGTYELTWTVSNGTFASGSCQPQSDTVTVTFNDMPPTEATAGPDQLLCSETQTNLAAQGVSIGLGTWTQTVGPSTATITSPNNPNSVVLDLIVGVYEFTWTTTTSGNNGCEFTDTVSVEVINQPTTVDAGPDQLQAEFTNVSLAAVPAVAPYSGTWTQISGPSTAVILNPNASNTALGGLTTGVYEFKWTITNGNCNAISDTMKLDIRGTADLELTKTASTTSANAGDTITYTLQLFNNNALPTNGDATGVIVQDVLPDGLSIVPGTVSNGGVYNAGDTSITWSNLTLTSGAILNLTYDTKVKALGSYTNKAQIIGSNQFDSDSDPSKDDTVDDNGDGNLDDDEATITIALQQANLSLNKTVLPTSASVGDTVEFTLVVINSGPDDATNVVVKEQLPEGYTYQSHLGDGTYDDGTGIWTVGTVASTGTTTKTLTIQAIVNPPTGVTNAYKNVSQIIEVDQFDPNSTPDNDDGDQSEDDESNAEVTLESADLELGKTVTPVAGNIDVEVTFTVTVTNSGSGDATGVVVKDVLPVGYTLVAGSVSNSGTYDVASSTLSWNNLSITSGSNLALTFKALVNAPTGTVNEYKNTAEIIASDVSDPDSTPNNDDGDQSEDDEASATYNVQESNLSIVKGVQNAATVLPANVGDILTFELEVTNSGSANATGVSITDIVPVGYSAITSISDGGIAIGNTIRWTNLTVASGSNLVVRYNATVNAPTGLVNAYKNIAQITASDQYDPNSTPNNDDGDQSEDDETSFDMTPQTADLSIDKQVIPSIPNVGDTVTFTITINNSGGSDATGVAVRDIIPSGYSAIGGINNGGILSGGNQIDWTGLSIVSGSSLILSFTAVVNPPTGTVDEYINQAEITASNQYDPDSNPNEGIGTDDNGDGISDDDEDTTFVTPQQSDLSIAKSSNTSSPNVGDTVTFTLTVTNAGPNVATGVAITDVLPIGYTLQTALGGTVVGNTASWSGQTIAANGGSILLVYTAIVNAPTGAAGEYTNNAQITASDQYDPDSDPTTDETIDEDGDGNPYDDDEAVLILTPLVADLSITKGLQAGSSTPNVGDELVFELIVSNAGASNATGIVITDVLPLGLTLKSVANGGIAVGNTVQWSGVFIPTNSTITLTYTAIVNAPTGVIDEYKNRAEITASDQHDPDSTPNNDDGDQSEDDEASFIVTPLSADLSLVKNYIDDNGGALNVGDVLTFSLVITNTGGATATNVALQDRLPIGYTLVPGSVSDSGVFNAGNSSINWDLSSVVVGTRILSYKVVVNTPIGAKDEYKNVAEITASDQYDPNSTPNNDDGDQSEDDESSQTITPTSIDLALTKGVQNASMVLPPNVGDVLTFELTLTNSGSDTATGVSVEDIIPSGYGAISTISNGGTVSGNTITWNGLSVNSGNTIVLTYQLTVKPPTGLAGAYKNKAQVIASDQYDADSTPNNDDGDQSEDDEANFEVVPQKVDISIDKQVSSSTPNVGDTVTFTITVANTTGLDTATGIVLEDNVPSGYGSITSISNGGTLLGNTIIWTGLTVNAGASVTLTYQADIKAPTGITEEYKNTVQVTAIDQYDLDSTPNNDNGNQSEDDEDSAIVTPQKSDISLEKSIDNLTPNIGDTVTYTLTLTNAGPNEATGVAIEDLLPTGLSLVAVNNGGTATGNTVSWTGQSIASNNGKLILTYTATVNAPTGTAGEYTNRAEVIASDQYDSDSTPNNMGVASLEDDEDALTIIPEQVDLSIAKGVQLGSSTPNVGDTLLYEVVVSNESNTNATNVSVEDILPTGLTLGTVNDGGIGIGNLARWSGLFVPANGTITRTYTATVNAPTGATNEYRNIAKISASDQFDPDSDPATDETVDEDGDGNPFDDDEISFTITPKTSDLSIVKTYVDDNGAALNIGDIITFSVAITNAGPSVATNISLLDNLPVGYTLIPGTISDNGIYNTGNSTISWTLPSVAVSTDVVTYKARINVPTGATDEYKNTVQITASDQYDPNSTPNNDDGDQSEDDESSQTIVPTSIDLALTKGVQNASMVLPPNVGDVLTFELTLTNSGSDTATGVSVEDIIPSGYGAISTISNGGTVSGNTITWNGLSVNSGNTIVLTYQLTVKPPTGLAGAYKNKAQVIASDQYDADSTPNNDDGDQSEDDEANFEVVPQQTDLSIDKQVSDNTPNVGDTVTFTITVNNSGSVNATNVAVQDVVPMGYSTISAISGTGTLSGGNQIDWVGLTVAAGGTETLTFDAVVDAPTGTVGEYTNTVQIIASDQYDADSDPSSGTATDDKGDGIADDDEDTVFVTPQRADISLEKIVNNSTPNVGDVVTFTVTLTNAGPDIATNVAVSDVLPSGLTLLTVNGGTLSGNTANWTAQTIPANNGTIALTYTATVNVPTGAVDEYKNVAQVMASDQFDPDSALNNDDGDQSEDDEANLILAPNQADLSITKTVVDGDITPLEGSEITFEIKVFNNGSVDATGVELVDVLPSGYDFILYSSTEGSYNENTGIWNVGTVTAGGSETLLIDVIVKSTGDYLNVAQITASDVFDPNSTPNNDDGDQSEDDEANAIVTPIAATADLSLTKAVIDNKIAPLIGEEITFEITILNSGPQEATGVVVEDVVPSGFDFVLFSSSKGTYNDTTGVWNIGTIATGDTETLLIDVMVQGTGNYTNVAQVIASNVTDPDSTPNNDDGDQSEDDEASIVVTPQALVADLSLDKSVIDNKITPLIGEEITFEIVVTNDGPQDVAAVQVEDVLPSGFDFVLFSSSKGSYDKDTGVWNVGTIANGDSEILLIDVTVNATGNYTNVAQVIASSLADPDSTPNNDDGDQSEDDEANVIVTPVGITSDISLTKTVVDGKTSPLVGDTITFKLVVANDGPQSTTNVTVTDILPSGFDFVTYSSTQGTYDTSTGLWTVGTIGNGVTETLLIDVVVLPTGNYTNIAEVTTSNNTDPDSTPNNDDGDQSEDDESSIVITPAALVADLSLEKTVLDGKTTPLVGDSITFKISVTNDGPQDATGVIIKDMLPSGFDFINYSSTSGVYNATSGEWTIGSIANGTVETLLIDVLVLSGGDYLNTAEVSASNIIDPDSTPNNDDGDQSEDDESSQLVSPIQTNADLSLTKSVVDNDITPNAGDEITFKILVENNGPDAATNVKVSDILPVGFDFILYSSTSGTYDDVTGLWDVGTIPNGGTQTLFIDVLVNLPTGTANEYLNITEIIASDQQDPDSIPNNDSISEDDQDSVQVFVEQADLSLEKTVSKVKANVGEEITFTLQINNDGPNTATGVSIEDIMPKGYSNITGVSDDGILIGDTIKWTNLIVTTSGITLTYRATVNLPTLKPDEYLNIAEITSSDQFDPDSTVNNDDGDQSEDDESRIAIETPVTDILLEKTVSKDNPIIGEEVLFEIRVSNLGGLSATSVEILEQLPSGYKLLSAEMTSGNYNESKGIWTVPNVINGTPEILKLRVEVLDVNDYVNTVYLEALEQIDVDKTNNSSSAKVIPQCLTINNGFSPNNNGVNDVFYIDCISNYPNNKLEIYNRWGNLVYSKEGYDNTFKGVSNGRAVLYEEDKLPVGTYYYILDLGDGSPKKMGWLYLNR